MAAKFFSLFLKVIYLFIDIKISQKRYFFNCIPTKYEKSFSSIYYNIMVIGLGGVDGMKSSPGGVGGGGPGTPREDSGSGMGDYNLSEYTHQTTRFNF